MRYATLTTLLIALNLIAYLVTVIQSGSVQSIPLRTLVGDGALYGPLVVLQGEWWRLLSAIFLHGGAMHIVMNMVSLYIVGRGTELYFSKAAYVAIYLLSGLIGAMASLYTHPFDVAMGASGAIFGIFGALLGFFLVHRDRLGADAKRVFEDFVTIIVLNVALGFAMPSIDMSAHIGGFITGLIGGVLVASRPQRLAWFVASALIALWIGKGVLETHYATLPF